jgi:predicted kinase
MKKVIIPRGIPGSGKSTWVKEQLATHPAGTAVRINNDELSFMIYGQPWGTFFFSNNAKDTLHEIRLAMLRSFLSRDYITHIYVDNTNLATQTVRALEKVAYEFDADFIVDDRFLSIPIEVCIERDAKRDIPVTADIIRKMNIQASKLKRWSYGPYVNVQKYENNPELKPCIIVDIDGTLAHMGNRSPYDWKSVGADTVDTAVRDVVNSKYGDSLVIVMSGRDGSCFKETHGWLTANGVKFDMLLMREAGDQRPDWITKHELFQRWVSGNYYVEFVLDDRNQVVNLWRNKLGLPTWQVANGDF